MQGMASANFCVKGSTYLQIQMTLNLLRYNCQKKVVQCTSCLTMMMQFLIIDLQLLHYLFALQELYVIAFSYIVYLLYYVGLPHVLFHKVIITSMYLFINGT